MRSFFASKFEFRNSFSKSTGNWSDRASLFLSLCMTHRPEERYSSQHRWVLVKVFFPEHCLVFLWLSVLTTKCELSCSARLEKWRLYPRRSTEVIDVPTNLMTLEFFKIFKGFLREMLKICSGWLMWLLRGRKKFVHDMHLNDSHMYLFSFACVFLAVMVDVNDGSNLSWTNDRCQCFVVTHLFSEINNNFLWKSSQSSRFLSISRFDWALNQWPS